MGTLQPVFRTIEIMDGLELTLDRPIPDNVMPYMQSVGQNRWTVDPSMIKNASSITVTLVSEGGPVQSMDFTYPGTASFDDLKARYSEPLGPPTSSGDLTATWEDSATRFTLTARGSSPTSIITSTLTDA